MTARITFKPEQVKQYSRLFEDAKDRALKEVNPDKDGLQNLIEKGGEFQAYLIAGVRRFTAKTPDYEIARMILGKDFISPEEITEKRKGIIYTDDQLTEYGKTLPSHEVLEWCRDHNFMLAAGPAKPMSLLEVRELQPKHFCSKSGGWYAEDKEKFSRNDKVETRWIMLRKEPIDDSTSKNWGEQQALLSELEIVPNIAELTWGVTTYKAVRGIYLLQNVYVRTSSLGSDGNHVLGGSFDGVGFEVYYNGDSDRYDRIGLAGLRKP